MLTVGIIGAGSISDLHLRHYKDNPDCVVKSIADCNIELAKAKAEKYGIKTFCSDYHEILSDSEIDAVCILTPTFTHKDIVLEAISNKKHIFCEKPPALNADEVRLCVEAAKNYDKCLMYGFVCRFKPQTQYMKSYIDSGKMGKIFCAEAARLNHLSKSHGWFASKKLGGGALKDGAIHELDQILYLMNYPKPKTVLATSSTHNKDLPYKIESADSKWKSANATAYERDIEDFIKGLITFEDGSSIIIKASDILNTLETGTSVEINGEKAGFKFLPFASRESLKIIEISDDYCVKQLTPTFDSQNVFQTEVNHFVNCCLGKEECIIKPQEAVTLMEIIDAIYKSAETGKAVNFN